MSLRMNYVKFDTEPYIKLVGGITEKLYNIGMPFLAGMGMFLNPMLGLFILLLFVLVRINIDVDIGGEK